MSEILASRRSCRLEHIRARARAGLALALIALSPLTGRAAAPTERAPAERDPFAAIGAQLQRGQERFDIADYEGAVELWSDAYTNLPDGPDAAAYRNMLAYQISTACREAYKVNHDIKYLNKAEHLLVQYSESLGAEDEEARASAEEALSELRAEIDAESEARAVDRAKNAEGLEELRTKIREEEERAAAEKSASTSAENDRARTQQLGLSLQIAGGVSMGVGAALLGVMGYALARGASIDSEGQELADDLGADAAELEALRDEGVVMNQLALGTAISGGVLLLTGGALITVGTLQRTQTIALTPSIGPRFTGLSLSGRF